VNGNTAIGSPVTVTPGDTVTYRVTVTLPTTSANNFVVTDFLPLPIFTAAEFVTPNLTTPSATPPPAGVATLGPSDTFYARYRAIGGTGPTAASNLASTSGSLDFGPFTDPLNTPTTLDILFTVTATAAPKSDQLLLTNELVAQQTDSQNQPLTDV